MVEGGRQIGAAGPLCIAGAEGQLWACRSARLLAFQSGSQERRITGRRGFCYWAIARAAAVGPIVDP